MDFLFTPVHEELFYAWELWIGDWSFVIALAVLAIEFVLLGFKKRFSKKLLGDSVSNFITLFAFMGINLILIAAFYVSVFYIVYEYFSITQLPLNGWTLICCILLADLAYYWEHRFMHRTGIGWATHTVHHSSPYFNISVAYRFGPLDGIMPIFFHLPLAALGFNPLIIFLSEALVQIYQTLLHTEVVRKLPRPIEAIFNTPSHHRVHHGCNPQYLDKNYAGILIIWDRMFGTYAREEEKVRYGVFPQLESINPLKIFCHGLVKLASQLWHAKGISQRWQLLAKPPGSVEVELPQPPAASHAQAK